MAEEVAAGQIDAGVLWGPIAGYYAQRVTPHLVVVPLLKEQERHGFLSHCDGEYSAAAIRIGSAGSIG